MPSKAAFKSRRNPLAGKSTLRSVVAPVGGWNARDSLSEMKPEEAVFLDNLIPDQLGVRIRRGMTTYGTGITGNFVESLMEYNSPGSNPKLFAAAPNTIFDVTLEGAASSAVTSLTNGRWQHAMFNAGGGDYLVACNGADDVLNYDGSSWTTPTINNVSSSSLVNVSSHMSRLWFMQNNSLSVWYLDVLSIAGDATEFDLSGVSKRGGYVMAMGSWSRDGGEGLDDVAVFITSEGEIHIYAGTDPDNVSTWSRVGTFNAPRPIGRRCVIKLGADLLYLSEQGVLSLPNFLAQNSAGVSSQAVTDKISGAFKSAYREGGDLFGWQIIEYHKENLLICNVPIRERTTQHQYVMNLKTGAWCRFKDVPAGCWGRKGNDLFCGGNDGIVRIYGETSSTYDDDGEAITVLGVQAFNDFGTPLQKRFTMVRPWVHAPPDYVPQVKMLVDFDDNLPTFDPVMFESVGPEWDLADWDDADWGYSTDATAYWQSVTGTSAIGAPAVSAALTANFIWNRTDVLFEPGGVL